MICDNCREMIEDDSRFCKYCGEGVQEPVEQVQPTERRFPCPRCEFLMKKYDYGGFLLDVCGGCGGQWADRQELDNLLAVEKKQFTKAEAQQLRRTWKPRLETRQVPLRNAMNEVLRDGYVKDNQRGVDRWNKILR